MLDNIYVVRGVSDAVSERCYLSAQVATANMM